MLCEGFENVMCKSCASNVQVMCKAHATKEQLASFLFLSIKLAWSFKNVVHKSGERLMHVISKSYVAVNLSVWYP